MTHDRASPELSSDTFFDEPPSQPSTVRWEPTRAAGLARLDAFLPRAGRAYARDRNIDFGPADRRNISALSPWIRRRLVTEEEVVAAVVARHGFVAASKFIDEVCWRSYWKGWLQLRPAIYARYLGDCAALDRRLSLEPALAERVASACAGNIGIDCFDAWARELVETGFLHNHARMWFASIWIFTLKLPWQLGARFFARHLLDYDPASNLLSWRWVGGLHSVGKHYLARAENIRAFTNGRFFPKGQLDERAPPLVEDALRAPLGLLPMPDSIRADAIALLLNSEDLHPESWRVTPPVVGVAAFAPADADETGAPARLFRDGSLVDGLQRAQSHFSAPNGGALDAVGVVAWARALGVREIVTGFAPIGETCAALDGMEHELAAAGIRLTRLRRQWDEIAWPQATAGFFRFREVIPELVALTAR
jgi:deoxyribodipyrimidine photo-lyase